MISSLRCFLLGAIPFALAFPQPGWAYDRPVLTLSSPQAVPQKNPEIRTSDSIVVAGRLTAAFQANVTMNLYHVLPSGRVASEQRVSYPVSQDGAFRFELFAPRGGWTRGPLRAIVQVEEAPQVRQEFQLTVLGDPVPEQVLDTLERAPKEPGGTLVLEMPEPIPRPNYVRSFGANVLALGRVSPVPPVGTEVALRMYHVREDRKFVAEGGIAVSLLPKGEYRINLGAPRRGWQNGRLIGVVSRTDAPEDRRSFEDQIVGAPAEEPPPREIRLLERSETVLDLRAPELPAIPTGMRYVVAGESPIAAELGQRQGYHVMLEIVTTRDNGLKGVIQQSRGAPTLANDAGVLEFETELEVREDIPPGDYQLHQTSLIPRPLFPKVYTLKILPRQDKAPD